MNLSDPSDDESSSDGSLVPAKRPRSDTYGASSTTSHGSVFLESDDEHAESTNVKNTSDVQNTSKTRANYSEKSSNENLRLSSRSSVSENCSSPNEEFDNGKPSFDDNDTDNEETSMRPSFQNSTDTFYNKVSDEDKDADGSVKGGYSEMSKRMMSNMGYKPGKGLGKFEHGRVEPVEASTQKGKRGLGLKPSVVGDVPSNFEWNPDESQPEATEEVSWMPTPPEETLSGDVLEEWLQRGPKKLTIDDETNFVEPNILKGVLKAKTIFDSLDDEDLRHARFRSNPYETIGSVIFLNRAAVKMANLDAIFDFMFTQPKHQNGNSAVDTTEILYFADVCAGPGGFSEYVLFRRGWEAKGFGFTLKGPCDFKLSDFYAGTPETFTPFYGVKDDGNVFDPANLTSLKEHVLEQTDDKGVHFLMADGGFSVEGQENLQEILSKQLYLCQCLAALMLVRTGGHFVVKIFDVFTVFSVGLIYIMYRCFDKVCIHKPVTSRPANSERYLVCMWKKLGTEPAERHLYSVNSLLWNGLDSNSDVTELVPMSVIQEDTGFYEYIYKSNCVLGEKQIQNLLKIAAFSKDKELKEESQATMRKTCLELWKLPDKVRTQPKKMHPDEMLMTVLSEMKQPPQDAHNPHAFKSNVLNKPPQYLEKASDLSTFKSVYDWHLMFLSSGKSVNDLSFFIGCGGKQVYQLEGSRWKNLVDLHISMPPKTLIYGEVVKEYRGQGLKQIFNKALHIVDALMLGGKDISHLSLTERINTCALFCTAINKPFDKQAVPLRCKRLYNLELFGSAINQLEYRDMKFVKRAVTINTPNRNNRNEMFYVVGSLLFVKEVKEPWECAMSKTHRCKYYHRPGKHPQSGYCLIDEAKLDMINAFLVRVLWPWEDAASAILDGRSQRGVLRTEVEEYIRQKINR